MFTKTEPVEEMAQQASLIASQIPKANPISSVPHLHKPPYRNRSDGKIAVNPGNNYDNAQSDFNVGVRIQRAIIRDARPLDEESEITAEQDVYPPQVSGTNTREKPLRSNEGES